MVHIYSISDKLLLGKQINTISAYFAESLYKYNLKISEHSVVSVTSDFIKLLNKQKPGDVYILFVEKANSNLNSAISQLTDCLIQDNENVKNCIYEYYRKRNCPLEKYCENEWKIPSKARAIINPNNTTQGYILEKKEVIFCVLPLEYNDARQMFDNIVLDYLLKNQKKQYKNYTFKTFGLSISNLNSLLADYIKNKEKISINLFEKDQGVDIVLKSQQDNENLDIIAKKIFLKLDNYIYSIEDLPIEKVAFDLIKINDLKISFAETITGGKMASKLFCQSENSANFVSDSVIVLSNESKQRLLGVDPKVIETEGEISVNVVHQMALNLLKQSNSDIVVASVGNVNSNTSIPMGLSYIAVGDKKEIHIYKNIFIGSMEQIIESIVTASYFYLIKKLKKNDFHFEKTTV